MKSFAVIAIFGLLVTAFSGFAEGVTFGRLSPEQPEIQINASTIVKIETDALKQCSQAVFSYNWKNHAGSHSPGLELEEDGTVVFQWLPTERILWIASSREIRRVDFSQDGTVRSERYLAGDFTPGSAVPGWFAAAVKELSRK